MKKDLEENLKHIHKEISTLRSQLQKKSTEYISQRDFLQNLERCSLFWFDNIEPHLSKFGIKGDICSKYADLLRGLLRLSSAKNSRKSSIDKVINLILADFRDELIIPVQTFLLPSPSTITGLDELFAEIKDPLESEYLTEAIQCASNGFLRAAIVLGWSAAIDRVHRKIEELGFDKFNSMSFTMSQQNKGRYKNFNQKQDVNSLSDLRTIFDNIILWVLEGMNLIDINQHTRLKSCFDMRCHAAHPGDAPTTIYNLMSFFSDLNVIIFKNHVFQLNK